MILDAISAPRRGNAWVKAWDIGWLEAAYRWGSRDAGVAFSFIFCCGGLLASYTSQGEARGLLCLMVNTYEWRVPLHSAMGHGAVKSG